MIFHKIYNYEVFLHFGSSYAWFLNDFPQVRLHFIVLDFPQDLQQWGLFLPWIILCLERLMIPHMFHNYVNFISSVNKHMLCKADFLCK